MTRPRLLLGALLLPLLALPVAASRWVVDAQGRRVQVPDRVRRVVVGGALCQMAVMLGAEDKIVATAGGFGSNHLFARIFPRIAALPSVGNGIGQGGVNIESTLSHHPDVVFGSPDQMGASGVPVVAIDFTSTEGVQRSIRAVAQALGDDAPARAEVFLRYYDSVVAQVRKATASLPSSRRPRVYVAGGKDGLSTEGAGTVANSWIPGAGGVNVAAATALTGLNKAVSLEQVIAWDPEVIFTSPILRDRILGDPRWARLSAVRARRIYTNPRGVHPWSARGGESALMYPWAAKCIHPELFRSLDIASRTRGFYKRFYRYAISDAEIAGILEPRE